MTDQLFTATELGNMLQCSVTDEAAAAAERLAWGWLKPVLGITTEDRPATVTAEVFAWAIELGAIAYENPSGLSAYQLGDERSQYSAERRNEILATAAAGGKVASSGVPSPRGTFPTAECWPDPIRRRPAAWYQ